MSDVTVKPGTPTTFAIPVDPRAADSMAGGLGEIATAAEWKRSAIVYARVRVQDGRGRPAASAKVNFDLLTPEQYSLLGIHGLPSKTTVRAYWRAWDNAVTEGLTRAVSLGDTVVLPDAEWSDYFGGSAQPATPPYYVPDSSFDQPLQGEVILRNEHSASHEHPARRNGGGGHRGPLTAVMTLRRVGSQISNITGLKGDDAEKQTRICHLIDELVAGMQPFTESA